MCLKTTHYKNCIGFMDCGHSRKSREEEKKCIFASDSDLGFGECGNVEEKEACERGSSYTCDGCLKKIEDELKTEK